jgi:hypothetical protein
MQVPYYTMNRFVIGPDRSVSFPSQYSQKCMKIGNILCLGPLRNTCWLCAAYAATPPQGMDWLSAHIEAEMEFGRLNQPITTLTLLLIYITGAKKA